MSLVLRFSFRYTPKLVTSRERNPTLHFWLSSDVGNDYKKVDPAETSEVALTIAVPKGGIPVDASLNCKVFVDTTNSRGEPSSNEAGATAIALKEILNNTRQIQFSQDLLVYTANEFKKGEIAVTVARTGFLQGQSPFATPGPYDLIPEHRELFVSQLVNFMKLSNVVFEKKASTFPSVAALHLPFWQFNMHQVPGEAFAMVRAKPSPEAWWSNMADIALRRHYFNMPLKEARSHFLNKASECEVMTVVAKTHSIFINYCTYLSDGIPVERQTVGLMVGGKREEWEFVSMEAFSDNIRARGNPALLVPPGADCEDGGAEQGFEAMELLEREDWTDPVLMKMHDARKNYFYLQSLKGVRGAQLSDSTDPSKDYNNLGGHMCGSYMHRSTFAKLTQRYNVAKPNYEELDAPRLGRDAAPILTLEGTGLIDPLGFSTGDTEGSGLALAEQLPGYQYLYADEEAIFGQLKFISPQKRDALNDFYRVVQSAAVPDLATLGYSSIQVVFLKKDRRGEITTGVSYTDFLSEDPSVMAYSMPDMSHEQAAVVKQIMKHVFPVKAFEVPQHRAAEFNDNVHLQRVAMATQRQNRTLGTNHYICDFFARYDQVTETFGRQLEVLAMKKSKLAQFQYFEEPVTTGIGGYLLRFYVNK